MGSGPAGDLPALWQSDFTVDNVIDYARAARELSYYVQLLAHEGFHRLVVPSRGAVPFVEAASSAWRLRARAQPTYEERVKALRELDTSAFLRKLELPFSADPHESNQTTAAIRTYWSQVLAAIVRRDGTDPRLCFYKTLTEKLAGRNWLDNMPRDLPNERFLFVDTVISGRAVCEIIKAFEDCGLDQCHFVLILDASGKDMAPQYRRVIDQMVRECRCTLIPVSRLFTEDRGPAVSGVWSTVYPQILDAMRQKFPWAADAYGAGTFYHRVSSSQVRPEDGIGDVEYNMPVTRMYASLSVLMFTALYALHQLDDPVRDLSRYLRRDIDPLDPQVDAHREEIEATLRNQLQFQLIKFHKTIEELKPLTPLDKRTTQVLAEPRVKAAQPDATVSVSSSHLVRVTLPDDLIDHFIREAEREIALGRDVLADDWFR